MSVVKSDKKVPKAGGPQMGQDPWINLDSDSSSWVGTCDIKILWDIAGQSFWIFIETFRMLFAWIYFNNFVEIDSVLGNAQIFVEKKLKDQFVSI